MNAHGTPSGADRTPSVVGVVDTRIMARYCWFCIEASVLYLVLTTHKDTARGTAAGNYEADPS